jgi:hypothetical protein
MHGAQEPLNKTIILLFFLYAWRIGTVVLKTAPTGKTDLW